MSTDLTVHEGSTLTLRPEQSTFTPEQRAVLAHMGVKDAPEADLMVFAHVCQRTGLDPFARQIHMIGRKSKNMQTQQWETKYTIQTGIDGYRLIGRRAADRAGATISIGQPEWAHEDGSWRSVWIKAWGTPVAARVTISRNGEPFTAVAMFDEYAQTKRDGGLNSMWSQRPAGQIAKCAEALAWRMAFPQDLSGIYVDDEMHQADTSPAPAPVKATGMDALREAVVLPSYEAQRPGDVDGGDPISDKTRKRMFALLNERGITDRDEQVRGMVHIIGREIESRSELTEDEGRAVIARLEQQADQ